MLRALRRPSGRREAGVKTARWLWVIRVSSRVRRAAKVKKRHYQSPLVMFVSCTEKRADSRNAPNPTTK